MLHADVGDSLPCSHDCSKSRLDDFWDPADPRRAYIFLLPAAPQFMYPGGYHLVLAQLHTKFTKDGGRPPSGVMS